MAARVKGQEPTPPPDPELALLQSCPELSREMPLRSAGPSAPQLAWAGTGAPCSLSCPRRQRLGCGETQGHTCSDSSGVTGWRLARVTPRPPTGVRGTRWGLSVAVPDSKLRRDGRAVRPARALICTGTSRAVARPLAGRGREDLGWTSGPAPLPVGSLDLGGRSWHPSGEAAGGHTGSVRHSGAWAHGSQESQLCCSEWKAGQVSARNPRIAPGC